MTTDLRSPDTHGGIPHVNWQTSTRLPLNLRHLLLSYALLVPGSLHNWYGIAPTAVTDTQRAFVVSWIVIVTMLILAALRMPSIFLLLFMLVDVSLVLNLLGIVQESANMSKAAGWALMAVCALVVYLFLGAASHATRGRDFPLGRPILHV